jgi:hypothetical protein
MTPPPKPPRKAHTFWVIMAGNTPTAFRAREREDLVPTLVQLQRTQPTVSLKWFERNRIWSSPGEARDALKALKERRRTIARPRQPEWRPGGEHKDPHKRFELTRDQKRERFKARQRRPASGPGGDGPPRAGGGPSRGGGPPRRGAGPRRPPKPRRG